MEEEQFLRVLDLFPRVRSATYCEEDDVGDSSKHEESCKPPVSTANDLKPLRQLPDALPRHENRGKEDIFWPRLREAVEKKLSHEDAERFCDSFRQVHEILVHAALHSKTIHKALKSWEQR